MRKSGYYTGFVGKYGVGEGRESDFDFTAFLQKLIHWLPVDPKTKIEKLAGRYTRILGDSIHVTEKNAQDAIRFLKTRPKDKPFNLSVSFFATHAEDAHPDQYRYTYKIYINNKLVNLPYATEFRTAPLWRWRSDPPEFTMLTGSCAYVNQPERLFLKSIR